MGQIYRFSPALWRKTITTLWKNMRYLLFTAPQNASDGIFMQFYVHKPQGHIFHICLLEQGYFRKEGNSSASKTQRNLYSTVV